MWLRHWRGGDRPARRARVIVLHKNMPEWEWWWLRLDGVVPPQVLNCCDCDGECPGPGLEFLSRRAAGSTAAVAPSTNLGWSRFFSGSWDDHAFHDLNFKKLVSHPKFQIGLCKKIVGLFNGLFCPKDTVECQNVGYATPCLYNNSGVSNEWEMQMEIWRETWCPMPFEVDTWLRRPAKRRRPFPCWFLLPSADAHARHMEMLVALPLGVWMGISSQNFWGFT